MTLPPLPKNDHAFFDVECEMPDILVWNEKSMLDYGRACREAALEEAARACEGKVEREAGYNGQWEGYGRVVTERKGSECAAAIRALKEKP